jgi:hypothetical protein
MSDEHFLTFTSLPPSFASTHLSIFYLCILFRLSSGLFTSKFSPPSCSSFITQLEELEAFNKYKLSAVTSSKPHDRKYHIQINLSGRTYDDSQGKISSDIAAIRWPKSQHLNVPKLRCGFKLMPQW